MSSSLKIGLALAALVAAVFVVTLLSLYSKPVDKPDDKAAADGVQPLRFDLDVASRASADVASRATLPAVMHFDPAAEERAYREFPGFYERNQKALAYFWFDNPHPQAVRLTALARSCAACTSMAVATAPAAAQAPPADGWQELDFADADKGAEVPANSRGVVRLTVVAANKPGTDTKSATLGAALPGMPVPRQYYLPVALTTTAAYEVYPPTRPLGAVPEGAGPLPVDGLYFWSSTRGFDGAAPLPPPIAVAPGGDPFLVQEGAAVRLAPAETDRLAADLSKVRQMPVRVAAAYKLPLSFRRSVPAASGPPRELDLGPVEKVVDVLPDPPADDTPAPRLAVTATVLGAVGLEKGAAIDLGSFETAVGVDRTEPLVATRPKLELEAVEKGKGDPPPPDDPAHWSAAYTYPTFLKPRLDGPKDEGGRRTWELKVSVEPPYGGGPLPANAVVVLRVKDTGQLVRIPVKGTGRR